LVFYRIFLLFLDFEFVTSIFSKPENQNKNSSLSIMKEEALSSTIKNV